MQWPQENIHDKNDKSQEYDKSYYSDVNQYTPDYNYYYEPMKTQQQQSSYDDNNNNYNYDDTKQISYNDSYEDMKTYSTYPTKDKKYVCQTGQFQGFFVESVEFCKLKISEGPQGPIGPPGATGATGPIGPIGPNGTQGPPGIVNAELCPPGTDLENVFVLNGTAAESCDFVENPILDLAVANSGDADVSILFGNGDGTFGTKTDFPVGNEPASVAVGLFNSDSILDLAVANQDVDNVSILLGNGDGTFGAANDFPVGDFPVSVAVGLFNSDSILDLAVAHQDSANVSILLSNGDGTFRTKTDFAVGDSQFASPRSVAVGFFNSDSILDLAVS